MERFLNYAQLFIGSSLVASVLLNAFGILKNESLVGDLVLSASVGAVIAILIIYLERIT
jgi:uncharacterized membrane protein YeaQ/YmgE (transglycosylase-associated protein family)